MAKKFQVKVCITCGKEFVPSANCQKHCCEACRRKAYAATIKANRTQKFVCSWCGTTFEAEQKRKYCTADCRLKANARKRRVPKKKPKPTYTLSKVALLAREAGMTYGEYVAKMGL